MSEERYQLEDESAHLDEMPLMMSEEGFENDEMREPELSQTWQWKCGCGSWEWAVPRAVN
ncbi:hypothetical protein GH733_001676 [Mirounga leonina]|nr:hypothetical protein GH733_001676 [Mirounga leonina]